MQTKLIEITQIGSATAGVLDITTQFWPGPGQYLPCQRDADPHAILTTNLFRVLGPDDRLYLGPLPEHWLPGDQIRHLPPQGHGFSLPPTARRIGLLALGISPLRLLPLLKIALAQNAALVLFWDAHPTPDILHLLPTMVEVAPTASVGENLDWLDYLAVDLEMANLPLLDALTDTQNLPFEGQVLVRTPMPCRGIGECGVCAVKTHHGWKLACTDGPVFDLQEVLHVA
jgi:dihydroorotate dehydrogenase electron transfer subunit